MLLPKAPFKVGDKVRVKPSYALADLPAGRVATVLEIYWDQDLEEFFLKTDLSRRHFVPMRFSPVVEDKEYESLLV